MFSVVNVGVMVVWLWVVVKLGSEVVVCVIVKVIVVLFWISCNLVLLVVVCMMV